MIILDITLEYIMRGILSHSPATAAKSVIERVCFSYSVEYVGCPMTSMGIDLQEMMNYLLFNIRYFSLII